MATGRSAPARRCALLALAALACDVPQDPRGTLDRVRGGVLRVGVAESPPLLVRTGAGAAGPEAELVRAFARSIDARVEWRWGAADAHLEALERYQLDLVAAGLTAGSPWRRRVAFTRPWRQDGERRGVLAVPPGENATLVALERVIVSSRAGEERP